MNTKMNLRSESYEVDTHLRYICEDGYKRQAGTSNLAICRLNDKTNKADWKYGNISCIRNPLIPITTPSETTSPFTSSVSGSSHVSTSSSTTIERFTTSAAPTVKIHDTQHTTQTQIPGGTPVTRSSIVHVHTTPGRTHSPELFAQTLLPTETVKTVTEQTTVSSTAPVRENTGYTATVKHSAATDFRTPVHTTISTDTWQKKETIATAVGVVVTILVVGGIILVYCRKRSSADTCPRPPEDPHIPLQTPDPEDNSPDSHTPCKESEEEVCL
ncbi:interleukin-15 receptor subunit alpha isoform X1 [Eleutherodactylus coqui]